MPTDDERREVARRLRDDLKGAKSRGYYCSDSETVRYLCKVLGLRCSRCLQPWRCLEVLAGLIEPSGHECAPGEGPINVRHDNDGIDRERLLAIATLMAADSVRSVKQGDSVSPVYILHAARNIAEACGETFGSIRNRELAEWGTSIVPKETIVDRDALLELADEMDRHADMAAGHVAYAARFDFAGWARRIREALGVDDV